MSKVIKFFIGMTKYHRVGEETDPKQLGLWEEWLTKEFGTFLRQIVTSCQHIESSGMIYETQYCYTVSTMEGKDYIHWDVFMDKLLTYEAEWAKRLEQYTIGLLIQDVEYNDAF